MSWHHVQNYADYVDFDRELSRLDDKFHTTIDLRLTFDKGVHSAYVSFSQNDDYGNTIDLFQPINITWDEGVRLLGNRPELLEELT